MSIEDGLEYHKYVEVLGPLADPGGRVALRRRFANALLLRSRVRIPLRAWMCRLFYKF